MSDLISGDDLKKAYQLGLAHPRNELSLQQVVEKLSFTKEKAKNVLTRLVQTRAASAPKQTSGGDFVVSVREQDLVLRLKNIQSQEVYLVFTAVESFGAAGAGTRDMARYVNDKLSNLGKPPMAATNMTKALKQLETEKIIKQIRSIHQKGRKLYIVANVEADTSVVGGVFYKEGEFDTEMVDGYRERILQYVSSHNQASYRSIVEFLKSSGFKEDLSEGDLDLIFRTLVLDQLLTASVHPQTGELHYTEARWPGLEEMERLPCASCPLQDVCEVEDVDRFDSILLRQSLTTAEKNKEAKLMNAGVGVGSVLAAGTTPSTAPFSSKVTPATCPYFSQWLGLTFEPCVPAPQLATNDET